VRFERIRHFGGAGARRYFAAIIAGSPGLGLRCPNRAQKKRSTPLRSRPHQECLIASLFADPLARRAAPHTDGQRSD
jgi:hypothetical protein